MLGPHCPSLLQVLVAGLPAPRLVARQPPPLPALLPSGGTAVLLAEHRCGGTATAASPEEPASLPGTALLGALPWDTLLQVLGQAAWPLWAWIRRETPLF